MKRKKEMDMPNKTTWQEHLSLAQLPVDNPTSIEDLVRHDCYAITTIEHDYAGKTSTMWNAAYKHFGMNVSMAMMVGDSRQAEAIIRGFKEDPKYIGGGSGVGFKDENLKYVDELNPLAAAIGSINLIEKLPSGKLLGWNTDGIGYRQALQGLLEDRGAPLNGAKIVILGAGGTGNSVALALAESGADIVILNRTVEKAEELVRRINKFVGSARARAGGEDMIVNEVKNASVVINVSTKGATGEFEAYSALAPVRLPATPEHIFENKRIAEEVFACIPKETILSDVVLRGTPSPFLERARKLGFTTLDGVPMVVNQGVEAFMILHGEELRGQAGLRDQLQEVMRKAASF